ncbi:tripartite tricarboxylate transporter TctB family protein [Marinibaculum pumilum]|uniref:Tripartite tricarboxylate transporter TctB family protein n=1 Tax=Marinibaculum pumilum TaxID=1766165 RepID=A0ABV7L1R9_9PROT
MTEPSQAAAPDPQARAGAAAHDPMPHDLVAVLLGAVALALLAAAPWLVDTEGPDPFYKGPLIFPLIALGITAAGAVPAAWRLGRLMLAGSGAADIWRIDGHGFPWRAAGLFGVMCAFPLAILAIGLQAATFLALLAGFRVAGWRRPIAAPLVAAALTLLLHLAFRSFLDIWFPATLVGDWLADLSPGN